MNLITKTKPFVDPVSEFQSAMASAGILSDEILIALLKWSNWTLHRTQQPILSINTNTNRRKL